MSRHVQRNPKYEIAYGNDHLCGLFIQVYDLAHVEDDDEGLIVDVDERLNRGLKGREHMIEIAEQYGFIIQ